MPTGDSPLTRWIRGHTLTKAARMTGEIYYEILAIEPGASFEGTLSRVKGRCVDQARFKSGDREVVMTLWQHESED